MFAKINFIDVDGNKINVKYEGNDIEDLLNKVSYKLSDPDEFPETENPIYSGLNGVIDISKPVEILIFPE